jgi:hypothetical protein
VVIAAGVWGAACGGPTDPKPSTVVVTDTLEAWAINGTTSTEPSGFYLAEDQVVEVTSALTFDVAFDVDSATGQAVVIPVRLMTDGSVAAFNVGLQRLTQPFTEVTYAFNTVKPNNGYQYDSIFKLSPGQGLMIVSNPPGCATDPIPYLYGTFVVDSVNVIQRTVHFRATEDPNCGYRDLVPDSIPTF